LRMSTATAAAAATTTTMTLRLSLHGDRRGRTGRDVHLGRSAAHRFYTHRLRTHGLHVHRFHMDRLRPCRCGTLPRNGRFMHNGCRRLAHDLRRRLLGPRRTLVSRGGRSLSYPHRGRRCLLRRPRWGWVNL
jgi:hypothetical protein